MPQDAAIGELGKKTLDRVIEIQHTILGQQQGECREQRFGVRADPHLGIGEQWIVARRRGGSDRVDVVPPPSRTPTTAPGTTPAFTNGRIAAINRSARIRLIIAPDGYDGSRAPTITASGMRHRCPRRFEQQARAIRRLSIVESWICPGRSMNSNTWIGRGGLLDL